MQFFSVKSWFLKAWYRQLKSTCPCNVALKDNGAPDSEVLCLSIRAHFGCQSITESTSECQPGRTTHSLFSGTPSAPSVMLLVKTKMQSCNRQGMNSVDLHACPRFWLSSASRPHHKLFQIFSQKWCLVGKTGQWTQEFLIIRRRLGESRRTWVTKTARYKMVGVSSEDKQEPLVHRIRRAPSASGQSTKNGIFIVSGFLCLFDQLIEFLLCFVKNLRNHSFVGDDVEDIRINFIFRVGKKKSLPSFQGSDHLSTGSLLDWVLALSI